MMKLNTILGSYLPGFFRLKLETHEDIPSINEMSEEIFDIFLHEYCHYLQDVTTTAGLFNLYCISEYLHSVINRIYQTSSPEFEIPFDLTGDRDNVTENFKILKLTNGLSTNPINYSEAQSFKVVKISLSEESTPHISNISQVSLIDSTGQSRIFGAMTIKVKKILRTSGR